MKRTCGSPLLHRLAGKLCGLDVVYERLVPADMQLDFDSLFALCEAQGYRGLNITYPYKERVVAKLRIDDAHARAIGACNTVLFDGGRPSGFNTDCSGFASAFVESFGGRSPGVVAMAGAGGVGKAIGFALAGLGASELRLFDRDTAKAEALAASLQSVDSAMRVTIADCIEAATQLHAARHGRLSGIGFSGRAAERRSLGFRRGLHPRGDGVDYCRAKLRAGRAERL